MTIDDLHSHFSSFYPTAEDDEYMVSLEMGDINGMMNAVSPCHDISGCVICECFIEDYE